MASRHMSYCPTPDPGVDHECVVERHIFDSRYESTDPLVTLTLTGVPCDNCRVEFEGAVYEPEHLAAVAAVLAELEPMLAAGAVESTCEDDCPHHVDDQALAIRTGGR